MQKLKAVLFDLDGTLIDTAPDFVNVLNSLRTEKQLPPLPAADIRAQVSNGARALVKLGFDLNEGDTGFAELLDDLLERYLANLAIDSALFPGLDMLLAQLEADGIPWGIVTNKPSRYTFPLLEQLNLDKRCSVAICPDHVTHKKPHPEPMLLACSKIDVPANCTAYVGDHIRDIEAGKNAGCYTFAAAWGYVEPDDNIMAWGADEISSTPADLVGRIKELSA